ncbi:hypothetical protein ACOMHN_061028 [Nucella lapillus]
MYLDMVSGAISILVNLLLGTYSDLLGRRFLLLVPIVGHLVRNATAPVIIHWRLGLPALYAGYIVDGCCGGPSGGTDLLVVPISGHLLRKATAPVVIHWQSGLPALYVGYIVDGCCGEGRGGILLGLYVYTADITRSDQQRTLGMAIVETCLGLTSAVSSLGAGYFIEDAGQLIG